MQKGQLTSYIGSYTLLDTVEAICPLVGLGWLGGRGEALAPTIAKNVFTD